MKINEKILQRMERTITPASDKVKGMAFKARDSLIKSGYIFDGIKGIDYALEYVGFERLRIINGEPRNYTIKGLLMQGACGRGKTRLAMWLAHFAEMEYFSAIEIDEDYSHLSNTEFQRKYTALEKISCAVVIDDLGAESGNKRYGNAPYLTHIIERLYNKWSLWGTPCIITTNLPLRDSKNEDRDSIEGLYGVRAWSRIEEMCNPIFFCGQIDYRIHAFR